MVIFLFRKNRSKSISFLEVFRVRFVYLLDRKMVQFAACIHLTAEKMGAVRLSLQEVQSNISSVVDVSATQYICFIALCQ